MNTIKLFIPILTAGFAAFVVYTGYYAWAHSRGGKQPRASKKCSYELFESNSSSDKEGVISRATPNSRKGSASAKNPSEPSSRSEASRKKKKREESVPASLLGEDSSSKRTPKVERRDFVIKKIQAANALLSAGREDDAVALLIEAMTACSNPAALLHNMSTVYPMRVYKILIEKLSSMS